MKKILLISVLLFGCISDKKINILSNYNYVCDSNTSCDLLAKKTCNSSIYYVIDSKMNDNGKYNYYIKCVDDNNIDWGNLK